MVFEYDGSTDKALPQAVVFPSSTEQVSGLVALAHQEGIPVVGRGSGTGLSGGAITSLGGLQLVLTRKKRILEVDTDNRLAVVEPGVINLDLDLHVRKYGLRYAPDPSSQKACSLGGNVAENAGGPHCLAYGVTTNNVLGMEVVLEDGSVTWLGGWTREVPGYDLRGVFIGSEGTFGIATKIVLRLLPTPEAVKTILGIFPRPGLGLYRRLCRHRPGDRARSHRDDRRSHHQGGAEGNAVGLSQRCGCGAPHRGRGASRRGR